MAIDSLLWEVDTHGHHHGAGATLVHLLAADFGWRTADASWPSPVSDAGRRLGRRLCPEDMRGS
ncbi:hypothetical protein [Streptomyces caniferus]|uniref:hypothetical protein n=1 Tax=Streptomyces caniferus TaxID=285557 RepID=UPI003815E82B